MHNVNITDDELIEKEFIEEVFEIAFGDDAINRDYTYQEVLTKLKEFSNDSLIIHMR